MSNEINTALLDAVIDDQETRVCWLLEHGADPNFFEDIARITPLHFAAHHNALNVVPLLVMAGAKLSSLTDEGETPVAVAKRHGYHEMVRLLSRFSTMPTLSASVSAFFEA